MTNIIKKSNKYYYQIIDGKKKRISKKKYLEMKKYKIGGTNLTKQELIQKIYFYLIKNKIIRNENKLQNESNFFNEPNDISNYQSIKPFLFYSHLFTDSKIRPVYIQKNETEKLIKDNEILKEPNYTNNLFKNYYEIHIEISTDEDENEKIKYFLSDGGGLFLDLDLKNSDIPFFDFLYTELTYNMSNLWGNIMGIFIPQKDFIIIPIELNYVNKGGHQCVIIFDTINKKIYPFDPNNNEADSIIYTLASYILGKLDITYEIVSSNKTCSETTMGEDTPVNNKYFTYKCPLLGYSCGEGRGFCVQITFYYINFIVNNYNNPNNLNDEFLQTLILEDTNTRNMKMEEFNDFIDNEEIDINENINNIIFVYHMYQYFKILEWLNANGKDPNLLIDIDIDFPIYSRSNYSNY